MNCFGFYTFLIAYGYLTYCMGECVYLLQLLIITGVCVYSVFIPWERLCLGRVQLYANSKQISSSTLAAYIARTQCIQSRVFGSMCLLHMNRLYYVIIEWWENIIMLMIAIRMKFFYLICIYFIYCYLYWMRRLECTLLWETRYTSFLRKNVHITGVLWTFFYKDMYIYVLFNFPFLHILRLYYLKIFTILSLLFSAFIHCSYHLFLSLLYHFTYSFSLFLCIICSLFVLRSTIFIFPLSNISLIL